MTARGKAARAKGHAYELDVAHWFGVPTTRNYAPGAHIDAGDIVSETHCVDCKNHARWTVAAWFDHVEQTAEACNRIPALSLKRANRSTGDSLWVVRLRDA